MSDLAALHEMFGSCTDRPERLVADAARSRMLERLPEKYDDEVDIGLSVDRRNAVIKRYTDEVQVDPEGHVVDSERSGVTVEQALKTLELLDSFRSSIADAYEAVAHAGLGLSQSSWARHAAGGTARATRCGRSAAPPPAVGSPSGERASARLAAKRALAGSNAGE